LLDDSQLTQEVLAEVVEAINDAPDDVKEAFEAEVNVFGGATEQYVPAGSTITVEKRRTIIAVSAVVSTSPVAATAGGPSRRSGRKK
jgi:hypothetical protein